MAVGVDVTWRAATLPRRPGGLPRVVVTVTVSVATVVVMVLGWVRMLARYKGIYLRWRRGHDHGLVAGAVGQTAGQGRSGMSPVHNVGNAGPGLTRTRVGLALHISKALKNKDQSCIQGEL